MLPNDPLPHSVSKTEARHPIKGGPFPLLIPIISCFKSIQPLAIDEGESTHRSVNQQLCLLLHHNRMALHNITADAEPVFFTVHRKNLTAKSSICYYVEKSIWWKDLLRLHRHCFVNLTTKLAKTKRGGWAFTYLESSQILVPGTKSPGSLCFQPDIPHACDESAVISFHRGWSWEITVHQWCTDLLWWSTLLLMEPCCSFWH